MKKAKRKQKNFSSNYADKDGNVFRYLRVLIFKLL